MSDSATPWTVARQAFLSVGFSRWECGVGCHALLQGIFQTQGSNQWDVSRIAGRPYRWATGEGLQLLNRLVIHPLRRGLQWLLVDFQSCAAIAAIGYRTISLQNKHSPLVFSPHFGPVLSASGKPQIYFCLYRFACSNTSWKWNRITCGLLWLASQHSVFKVHPCCGMYQQFIFVAK